MKKNQEFPIEEQNERMARYFAKDKKQAVIYFEHLMHRGKRQDFILFFNQILRAVKIMEKEKEWKK